VVARRDDGFHEIESLVSAVTLYDLLEFTGRGDSGVELSCDCPGVPTDEGNLIVQAAMLLSKEAGRRSGVACRLTKRIPVGGGLGGGSSNGASTLTALNRLWGLNWPTDRLMPLAASLGSDVPFFLRGGSAVMSGRGEQVRPVRLGWQGWIVLLLPGIGVSSGAVYRAWRPGAESPPAPVGCGMTRGSAIDLMGRTFNMLEPAVMEVCPVLEGLIAGVAPRAGRPVRVSGSGSALFTAFDAELEAARFARRVGEEFNLETRVVQPVEQASPGNNGCETS